MHAQTCDERLKAEPFYHAQPRQRMNGTAISNRHQNIDDILFKKWKWADKMSSNIPLSLTLFYIITFIIIKIKNYSQSRPKFQRQRDINIVRTMSYVSNTDPVRRNKINSKNLMNTATYIAIFKIFLCETQANTKVFWSKNKNGCKMECTRIILVAEDQFGYLIRYRRHYTFENSIKSNRSTR